MDSGFGAQSLEFRGLGYYSRVYIGIILGLYRGYIGDTAKENGNYFPV